MICVKCNKEKDEKLFHKSKGKKNGFSSWCSACAKESNVKRGRTKEGVIKTIFHSQKQSSVRRGHSKQQYSYEELKEWILKNGFEDIYTQWTQSEFKKDFKPSIDRLDDSKGYSFSNIRLTTWKENREKQYSDFRNNKLSNSGYFGSGHRPVEALRDDGSVFKEFISLNDAKRFFNLKTHSNISSCCTGKKEKCAGYRWRYKDIKENK